MEVIKTNFEGVVILEPKYFEDNRGFFVESYSYKTLKSFGIETQFVQDNHSFSKYKNTLRGIHFQNNPRGQAKLVRCTKGKILDVIVDLRKNSLTYKKWIAIELSEKNRKQIYIPIGFGHSFLTLTENSELQYKVNEYYDIDYDRTIAWNDKGINISWGVYNPILSDKDKNAPTFEESDVNF